MRIPLHQADEPGADPRVAAILSATNEAWGRDFNVLGAVANSPQLLETYATFIGGVYAELPGDERELAYLTTAVVNECFY